MPGHPNRDTVKACTPVQPSYAASLAANPVHFFKLFFDEALMKTILEEIKRYSLQINVEHSLTLDELYVLFGAVLLSG